MTANPGPFPGTALSEKDFEQDKVLYLHDEVDARFAWDTGVAIATFGHAADGNFHVNIMYHCGDRDESRRALRAVRALMRKVVELGGAISGEHGIGLGKREFLVREHGEASVEAMRAIKRALDPKDTLNPGKLFPETVDGGRVSGTRQG
jgi:D-lactate dehydrogenase (cytochrome)